MAHLNTAPYHFKVPDGKNSSFGIVSTKWNRKIIERMLTACRQTFIDAGVEPENLTEVDVPGSFELPLAAKWLIESNPRLNGIVCLGVVIRGETSHYDYVCRAAGDGILRVMLDTGIPVAFGVLTVENTEQALERSGGRVGNKGAEAAMAVLELAELKKKLNK